MRVKIGNPKTKQKAQAVIDALRRGEEPEVTEWEVFECLWVLLTQPDNVDLRGVMFTRENHLDTGLVTLTDYNLAGIGLNFLMGLDFREHDWEYRWENPTEDQINRWLAANPEPEPYAETHPPPSEPKNA